MIWAATDRTAKDPTFALNPDQEKDLKRTPASPSHRAAPPALSFMRTGVPAVNASEIASRVFAATPDQYAPMYTLANSSQLPLSCTWTDVRSCRGSSVWSMG